MLAAELSVGFLFEGIDADMLPDQFERPQCRVGVEGVESVAVFVLLGARVGG